MDLELARVTVSKDAHAKETVSILLLAPDRGNIKESLVVKGLWIKRMGDEISEGAAVLSLRVTVRSMGVGLQTSLIVASIAVTMSLTS